MNFNNYSENKNILLIILIKLLMSQTLKLE